MYKHISYENQHKCIITEVQMLSGSLTWWRPECSCAEWQDYLVYSDTGNAYNEWLNSHYMKVQHTYVEINCLPVVK